MTDDLQRHADEIFPSDYAGWRYCIEVKCGISLTQDFLQARIAVLGDSGREETQRFTKLYGDDYREQVLVWFRRAADEA